MADILIFTSTRMKSRLIQVKLNYARSSESRRKLYKTIEDSQFTIECLKQIVVEI